MMVHILFIVVKVFMVVIMGLFMLRGNYTHI